HLRYLSLLLFRDHFAAQAFFMGFSLLGVLASDALCLITAWGVGHQRNWSRWAGLLPCVYMLLAFPYLSIFGLAGLLSLSTQPRVKAGPLSGAEFWNPRRQSGWMVIASFLGWVIARLAFVWLQVHAMSNGLSPAHVADPGLIVFLILVWLHVAIHECGHALAAW